ncbi:MAG: ATP synthase F1 subunit delta [Lentisphaerae bacterium]|nr:ATP synthase F1 subunit delta [Lentisphaerota bacterium]
MSEYRVAARYAKALFLLSEEQGATVAVRQDLADLRRLIQATPDLASFLAHAALSSREQQVILDALFKGRAAPLTARLLGLLVERRRLMVLPDVCSAYEDFYRAAHQILEARLVSAYPLRPDQVEALRQKLETKYRHQIDLAVDTDAALLGGFVVRVRDTVHDCSVRGKLDALFTSLAHA